MSFNVTVPADGGFGSKPFVVGGTNDDKPIVEIAHAGANASKAAIWSTLVANQMVFRLEQTALDGSFLATPEFRLVSDLAVFEADGFVLDQADADGNSRVKHGASVNKTVTYGFDIEERFTNFQQRIFATRQAQLDDDKFLTVGDLKHEAGKQGTKSSALTDQDAFEHMDIYECVQSGPDGSPSTVETAVLHVAPGTTALDVTVNGSALGSQLTGSDAGEVGEALKARLESEAATVNVATVESIEFADVDFSNSNTADTYSVQVKGDGYPLTEEDQVDIQSVALAPGATAARLELSVGDDPVASNAIGGTQTITFADFDQPMDPASQTLTISEEAFGGAAERESNLIELDEAHLQQAAGNFELGLPAASYPSTTVTLTVTLENDTSDTIVIAHTKGEAFATEYTFTTSTTASFGDLVVSVADNKLCLCPSGSDYTAPFTVSVQETLTFLYGETGGAVTKVNGPSDSQVYTYNGNRVGFLRLGHQNPSMAQGTNSVTVSQATYNAVQAGDTLKSAYPNGGDTRMLRKWTKSGAYYLMADAWPSRTKVDTSWYMSDANFNISGTTTGTFFNVQYINEKYFDGQEGASRVGEVEDVEHEFLIAGTSVTIEKKNGTFFSSGWTGLCDTMVWYPKAGGLTVTVDDATFGANDSYELALGADATADSIVTDMASANIGLAVQKVHTQGQIKGLDDAGSVALSENQPTVAPKDSSGYEVARTLYEPQLGYISEAAYASLTTKSTASVAPRMGEWIVSIRKTSYTSENSFYFGQGAFYNFTNNNGTSPLDEYEIVACQRLRGGVLVEGPVDGSSIATTHTGRVKALFDGYRLDQQFTAQINPAHQIEFFGTNVDFYANSFPDIDLARALNGDPDRIVLTGNLQQGSGSDPNTFAASLIGHASKSYRVLFKGTDVPAQPSDDNIAHIAGPVIAASASTVPLTFTLGSAPTFTIDRGFTNSAQEVVDAIYDHFTNYSNEGIDLKASAGISAIAKTDASPFTITFDTGRHPGDTDLVLDAGHEMIAEFDANGTVTLSPTAPSPDRATFDATIGGVQFKKTYNASPVAPAADFASARDLAQAFLDFAQEQAIVDAAQSSLDGAVVTLRRADGFSGTAAEQAEFVQIAENTAVPSSTKRLLAVDGNSAQVSLDGHSWTAQGAPGFAVTATAYLGARWIVGGEYDAGSQTMQLAYSEDNGATWTAPAQTGTLDLTISSDDFGIGQSAFQSREIKGFVSTDANTVYAYGTMKHAGAEMKMLKSIDGGVSWSLIAVPPALNDYHGMRMAFAENMFVIVGGSAVYKSVGPAFDETSTLDPVVGLGAGRNYYTVAFANGVWLIGAEKAGEASLYRSEDGAVTFAPVTTDMERVGDLVYQDGTWVASAPFFAGLGSSQPSSDTMYSLDNGQTWSSPVTLFADGVRVTAADGVFYATNLAGAANGLAFKTSRDAQTWTDGPSIFQNNGAPKFLVWNQLAGASVATVATAAGTAATNDEVYSLAVQGSGDSAVTHVTVRYGHSGEANSASTPEGLATLLASKDFGPFLQSATVADGVVVLPGLDNGYTPTITVTGGTRLASATSVPGVYAGYVFSTASAHRLQVGDTALLRNSTVNSGDWTVTAVSEFSFTAALVANALTQTTLDDAAIAGTVHATATSLVVNFDNDDATRVTLSIDSSQTAADVASALASALDAVKDGKAESVVVDGDVVTITSSFNELEFVVETDPLGLLEGSQTVGADGGTERLLIKNISGHGLVVGDVVAIESSGDNAHASATVLYRDHGTIVVDKAPGMDAISTVRVLNKMRLSARNNDDGLGALASTQSGALTVSTSPAVYYPARLQNVVTQKVGLAGFTRAAGSVVVQVSEDSTAQELARGVVDASGTALERVTGFFHIGDARFPLQDSNGTALNKTGADLSAITVSVTGAERQMFRTLDGIDMESYGHFEVGQYYVLSRGPDVLTATVSGSDAADFGWNDASKKYNLKFQAGALSVNTGSATASDALTADVTFSLASNVVRSLALTDGVARVIDNTIDVVGIADNTADRVNWGYYSNPAIHSNANPSDDPVDDTTVKTLQGTVQRGGANTTEYTIKHQLGNHLDGLGTFTSSESAMDVVLENTTFGTATFAKDGSNVTLTLNFTKEQFDALDADMVLQFTLKFTPTEDGVELQDPSLPEYVFYEFTNFQRPYDMHANDLDYAVLDKFRVLHDAAADTLLASPYMEGETYEDTNFYVKARSNAQIVDVPGLTWIYNATYGEKYDTVIDLTKTASEQKSQYGSLASTILARLRGMDASVAADAVDFTLAVAVDFLSPDIQGGYTRTDGASQTFHNSSIAFTSLDEKDPQKPKIHQLRVVVDNAAINLYILTDDASQTTLKQIDAAAYPDNLGANRTKPFATNGEDKIMEKITQFVCVQDTVDLSALGAADSVSNAAFPGVVSGNFKASRASVSGNRVNMQITYQPPQAYALSDNAEAGAGNFLFFRKSLSGGLNVLRLGTDRGVCARFVSLFNPAQVSVQWEGTVNGSNVVFERPKSTALSNEKIGQLQFEGADLTMTSGTGASMIPAGLYAYLDMDHVGHVRRDAASGALRLTRSAHELPTFVSVKVSNGQRGNGFAVDSYESIPSLGIQYTEDPLQSLHVLQDIVNPFRVVISGGDYGTGKLALPSVAGMTQVVIDGPVVLHEGATLAFDANTDVVLIERDRTITQGGLVRTSNELLGSIDDNSGFTTGTYYVDLIKGAKAKMVVDADGAVASIDVYEHGSGFQVGDALTATLGAKGLAIELVQDDIADIFPGDMSGIVENGGSVTFMGHAIVRTHTDYTLKKEKSEKVLGMVCGSTASPTKRFYVNREVVSLSVETSDRQSDAKMFVPCRMGSWTEQAAKNLSSAHRLSDGIRLPASLSHDVVVGDVVLCEGTCDLNGKRLVIGPSARCIAHRTLDETLRAAEPSSTLHASNGSKLDVEGASATDAAVLDGVGLSASGAPRLRFRHAAIRLAPDQTLSFDTADADSYIDRCDVHGPDATGTATLAFGVAMDGRLTSLEVRKMRFLGRLHVDVSTAQLLMQDFDVVGADAKVRFLAYGAIVRKMRVSGVAVPVNPFHVDAAAAPALGHGTFDKRMFQGLASPAAFENDLVLYKGGSDFNALARACAEHQVDPDARTPGLTLDATQRTAALALYDSLKGAMDAPDIADGAALEAAIVLGAEDYYLRVGNTFDKDVDQFVDEVGVEHFAGHMIYKGELLSTVRATRNNDGLVVVKTEKVQVSGVISETTFSSNGAEILVHDIVLETPNTLASSLPVATTQSPEAYAAADAQAPHYQLHASGSLGTPTHRRILVSGDTQITTSLTGTQDAPYILQSALGLMDKGAYALTRTTGSNLAYVAVCGSQGLPALTSNDANVAVLHTLGNAVAGGQCTNLYIEDCTGHALGAGFAVAGRVECVGYGNRLCDGTLSAAAGNQVYADVAYRPRDGSAKQYDGSIAVQAPFQAKFDADGTFETLDDSARLPHWWKPMAPCIAPVILKDVSTSADATIVYGFLKSSISPVDDAVNNTMAATQIGTSDVYQLKKTVADTALPRAVYAHAGDQVLAQDDAAPATKNANVAATADQQYRTERTASGDTVSLNTLESLNLPLGWEPKRYNIDCTSHPNYDVLLLPPVDDEESATVRFSAAKEIAADDYVFERMEHAYSSSATRPVNLGVYSPPSRRQEAFVKDSLTVSVEKQPFLELMVGTDTLSGTTRTRVLRQSELDLGNGVIKAIVKCVVQDRTAARAPSIAFVAATSKFTVSNPNSAAGSVVSVLGQHATADASGDDLTLELTGASIYDGNTNGLTVNEIMKGEADDSQYGRQTLKVQSVNDLADVQIAVGLLDAEQAHTVCRDRWYDLPDGLRTVSVMLAPGSRPLAKNNTRYTVSSSMTQDETQLSGFIGNFTWTQDIAYTDAKAGTLNLDTQHIVLDTNKSTDQTLNKTTVVKGDITITGDVTVSGGVQILFETDAKLTVTGTLTINGGTDLNKPVVVRHRDDHTLQFCNGEFQGLHCTTAAIQNLMVVGGTNALVASNGTVENVRLFNASGIALHCGGQATGVYVRHAVLGIKLTSSSAILKDARIDECVNTALYSDVNATVENLFVNMASVSRDSLKTTLMGSGTLSCSGDRHVHTGARSLGAIAGLVLTEKDDSTVASALAASNINNPVLDASDADRMATLSAMGYVPDTGKSSKATVSYTETYDEFYNNVDLTTVATTTVSQNASITIQTPSTDFMQGLSFSHAQMQAKVSNGAVDTTSTVSKGADLAWDGDLAVVPIFLGGKSSTGASATTITRPAGTGLGALTPSGDTFNLGNLTATAGHTDLVRLQAKASRATSAFETRSDSYSMFATLGVYDTLPQFRVMEAGYPAAQTFTFTAGASADDSPFILTINGIDTIQSGPINQDQVGRTIAQTFNHKMIDGEYTISFAGGADSDWYGLEYSGQVSANGTTLVVSNQDYGYLYTYTWDEGYSVYLDLTDFPTVYYIHPTRSADGYVLVDDSANAGQAIESIPQPSLFGFTATYTGNTLTIKGPSVGSSFTYSANQSLADISDMPTTEQTAYGTLVNNRHTWMLGGVPVTGDGACDAKVWLTLNNVTGIEYDMEVQQGEGEASPASQTFTFTAGASADNTPFTFTIDGVDIIRNASINQNYVGRVMAQMFELVQASLPGFTATYTDGGVNANDDTLTITGPSDGSSFTYSANQSLADISDIPTTEQTAPGTPGAPNGRVFGIDSVGSKILVGNVSGSFAAGDVTINNALTKSCTAVAADNRMATSAAPSMNLDENGVLSIEGLADPDSFAYQMQNEAFLPLYDAFAFGIQDVRHADYGFGSQVSDITAASTFVDVTAATKARNGVVDVVLPGSISIPGDSTPVFMDFAGMNMPTSLTINGSNINLVKVNHNAGLDVVQGAIRPDIHPQLSQSQTNGDGVQDYSYLPGDFSLNATGKDIATVILAPSVPSTNALQQANEIQQYIDHYQVFGSEKTEYKGEAPNDGHVLEFLRGSSSAPMDEQITLSVTGDVVTLTGTTQTFAINDFVELAGFTDEGNNGRFQLTSADPIQFSNASAVDGTVETASVTKIRDIGLQIIAGALKTTGKFDIAVAVRPSLRYKCAFGDNNVNGAFTFTTDLFPKIFKDGQSGAEPGTVTMLDGFGSAPDMGAPYAPFRAILDKHASYVGPNGGAALVQLNSVTAWSETMEETPRLFKIPRAHGSTAQTVGTSGILNITDKVSDTEFKAQIVTNCCIYVTDAGTTDYAMKQASGVHGAVGVGILQKTDGTEVLRVGDTITQGDDASATVTEIVVSGNTIQIEVGSNAGFVSSTSPDSSALQRNNADIFASTANVSWEVFSSVYTSSVSPMSLNSYVLFAHKTEKAKYGLLKVTNWSENKLTLATFDADETPPALAAGDDNLVYVNVGSSREAPGIATFKSGRNNAFKIAQTGSLKPDKLVILGMATHGIKTGSPGVYIDQANEYLLLFRVDNKIVGENKYQYRVLYIESKLNNPYTLMRTTTVGGASNNALSNVIRGSQATAVSGLSSYPYETIEVNVGNVDLDGDVANNPSHWNTMTRQKDLSGILIVDHDETTEHSQIFLRSDHALSGTLAELKRPSIVSASKSGDAFTFTPTVDVAVNGKIVVASVGSGGSVVFSETNVTTLVPKDIAKSITVANLSGPFQIYTQDASGNILESSQSFD